MRGSGGVDRCWESFKRAWERLNRLLVLGDVKDGWEMKGWLRGTELKGKVLLNGIWKWEGR